jgi:hypothetical protein
MIQSGAELTMVLALALLAALSSQPKDVLAEGFRNPPASARPHTWWHWMDGNVTKEGLTADLEAMKQVGIGGAQMFTVSQGIPPGPVGYMSPKWEEMVTHAVKEASRLGLELCIHNCAGWSSSGGPWIKPKDAMQVIAWSATTAYGPSHFSQQLPIGKAPQVYAKVDYYKDIAVYAFKTPSPQPRPRNFLGKTGVIREDGLDPDTSQAPLGAVIPSTGVIQLKADTNGNLDWNVPEGEWTILRIGHVPTGKDNHPAPPEGDGLEVDKLSREALDVHWAGMMAKIIKDVGPLAGKVLNNALIDSYEVGSQNWTPKMREEFQKRRGYDMMPWLPVIAGYTIESREKSERFLWDLRRTIADLYADNYFGYFGELCHKAGMKFSTEPYGNGGFDCIQSGGKADIPMGEFWIGGLAMETTKLASSVGHVYGRPVIGAESFTADDVRGKFLEEPYAIKALGDQVFCNGINRYIFHRYAAQPWLNLKPGMTMGPWGTHLDRTQTWWTEAGTWLKYVARCQYLLQSGTFVADGIYFSGENGLMEYVYSSGPNVKLAPGHDYDNCDTTILKRLTVKDGKLVLPSGMVYRVLVLPDNKFMTAPLAEKIRELVGAGATVVGPKPEQSPSLTDYPACDDKVKALADQVWGNVDGVKVKEHGYGKGRVIWGRSMQEVYAGLQVEPDFQFKGSSGRTKLVTIHRKTSGADFYFVSNQNYAPATADCTFRISGKQPELWHGDTGDIENAPVYRQSGGRTTVTLNLGPAESVFVVFRHAPTAAHLSRFTTQEAAQAAAKAPVITIQKARYEAADGRGDDVTDKVKEMVKEGQLEIPASNAMFGDPVVNVIKHLVIDYTLNGKAMKQTAAENDTIVLQASPQLPSDMPYTLASKGNSIVLTAWKSGNYLAETSRGHRVEVGIPYSERPLNLSADWHVAFAPNWGAPPSAEFAKLISWPDSKIAGIRYFSGSAVYSKDFNVSAYVLKSPAMLDLGRVKNFATVRLNGKELAVLWKEPFCVDVTKALRPGHNHLEIKVTNLWPNRMIGDEQLPPDVKWHGVTLDGWPSWLTEGKPRPKTGRYTFVTWKFWNKDSPLLESGLIGPVLLKSASVQTIRP